MSSPLNLSSHLYIHNNTTKQLMEYVNAITTVSTFRRQKIPNYSHTSTHEYIQ